MKRVHYFDSENQKKIRDLKSREQDESVEYETRIKGIKVKVDFIEREIRHIRLIGMAPLLLLIKSQNFYQIQSQNQMHNHKKQTIYFPHNTCKQNKIINSKSSNNDNIDEPLDRKSFVQRNLLSLYSTITPAPGVSVTDGKNRKTNRKEKRDNVSPRNSVSAPSGQSSTVLPTRIDSIK